MRLIDASTLKKAILEHRNDYIEDNFFWSKLFDIIDNAPTVEYPFYQEAYQTGYEEGKNERPYGKWRVYEGVTTCEKCGKETEEMTPFCAWCGSDMRKGGADNDKRRT